MSTHPCGCDPEANWTTLDCKGPEGCLSMRGKISLPQPVILPRCTRCHRDPLTCGCKVQVVTNETNPRLPQPEYRQEMTRETNPRALLGVDQHEPLPTKNDSPAIQTLVIADVMAMNDSRLPLDHRPLLVADIEARKQIGIERYGTVLQAFNGRDALMDAYQESLDLCMYLRQAWAEGSYVAVTYENALRVALHIRALIEDRHANAPACCPCVTAFGDPSRGDE